MFEEEKEENKTSCFAYINKDKCGALIKKNCKNCNFYKHTLLENDFTTKELIKKTKQDILNGVEE